MQQQNEIYWAHFTTSFADYASMGNPWGNVGRVIINVMVGAFYDDSRVLSSTG